MLGNIKHEDTDDDTKSMDIDINNLGPVEVCIRSFERRLGLCSLLCSLNGTLIKVMLNPITSGKLLLTLGTSLLLTTYHSYDLPPPSTDDPLPPDYPIFTKLLIVEDFKVVPGGSSIINVKDESMTPVRGSKKVVVVEEGQGDTEDEEGQEVVDEEIEDKEEANEKGDADGE